MKHLQDRIATNYNYIGFVDLKKYPIEEIAKYIDLKRDLIWFEIQGEDETLFYVWIFKKGIFPNADKKFTEYLRRLSLLEK